MKPDACDIFIFIGVWIDQIRYWVLPSEDVISNEYLSHQHRGGVEYQIGIKHNNIGAFDEFLVDAAQVGPVVIQRALGS